MTFDLKTSLDDLATAEYADAPPSTVDIGRARADGRRRVLASRLAPIGGGVAVVAACALVANGLGGATAAKPNTPASSAAGRPHFSGTDPLTATARFGWLPAGFQTASHTSGADYGDSVTARTEPVPSTTPTTPPVLTLTSSPTEPQLRGGQTKKPATVAGSSQAYLVTTPGDGPGIAGELSLEWRTASGNWFTLQGLVNGDVAAQLTRAADAVTPDGSAMPLPIHIEGLPTGVTLGAASLNDPITVGMSGFNVGLSYHSGSAGPGTGHYFSVTASAGPARNPANPDAASPNAADPGSMAGLNVKPAPSAANTCKDADGLHICVQDDPNQAGPDPLAAIGGAKGLLDRITSLGTDRANWTTQVVN